LRHIRDDKFIFLEHVMKKVGRAAKRLLMSGKIGLTCAAMCGSGLFAFAAHAQDKLSLPGLLKGAIQRQGGAEPATPNGPGTGGQPTTAPELPRKGEAAGSITGRLENIRWDSDDCNDPKVLGTSATFKIQRSADSQR
jgi:hypothetical protein